VGIGTPYLIGYPLEKALEIFWRAKKFKMATNATGSIPMHSNQNDGAYPSFDVTGSISDNGTIDSGKSLEPDGLVMVSFDGLAIIEAAGGGTEEPGETPPPVYDPSNPDIDFTEAWWGTYRTDMNCAASLRMFFNSPEDLIIAGVERPQCIKYNGLYYPTLSFSFLVTMGDRFDHVKAFGHDGTYDPVTGVWSGSNYIPVGQPPFAAVAYSAVLASESIITDGAFPLFGTIFGTDIGGLGWSLEEAPSTTGGIGGLNGQSIDMSGTINIDIQEWFEFDEADGRGPAWDNNNGRWLR